MRVKYRGEAVVARVEELRLGVCVYTAGNPAREDHRNAIFWLYVGQDFLRMGQEFPHIDQDLLHIGQDFLHMGQEFLHIGQDSLRLGQDFP